MIGIPPTGCKTLGVADRMRVPSPAASMIDSSSVMNISPACGLFDAHFHKIMARDRWRIHNDGLMVDAGAAPDSTAPSG
jgi:hypothetical protein